VYVNRDASGAASLLAAITEMTFRIISSAKVAIIRTNNLGRKATCMSRSLKMIEAKLQV